MNNESLFIGWIKSNSVLVRHVSQTKNVGDWLIVKPHCPIVRDVCNSGNCLLSSVRRQLEGGMSLAYVVNIAGVAEQVDSWLTVKKDPFLHVGNGLGKLMALLISHLVPQPWGNRWITSRIVAGGRRSYRRQFCPGNGLCVHHLLHSLKLFGTSHGPLVLWLVLVWTLVAVVSFLATAEASVLHLGKG